MNEASMDYETLAALIVDARKWREHVKREEERRSRAVAALYAEGAPVAQRTERRSSKPTVAGSTPVGGATPGLTLHRAQEPTGGRCGHGFPVGYGCCPGTPHRGHVDQGKACPAVFS